MPSIIRYSKPSRLDTAPFGTVYEVVMEPEQPSEFYIQISKDEQSPSWIPRGSFLELVFASEFKEDKFVQECLKKIE